MVPSPEDAPKVAALVVSFMKDKRGIDLDYSVPSLSKVDDFIEGIRGTDTVESAKDLLISLGCYVGEVLVRHAGGKWRDAGPELSVVINLPDGRDCTPISKAFKRFQNGSEDSIVFFYKVAATLRPGD